MDIKVSEDKKKVIITFDDIIKIELTPATATEIGFIGNSIYYMQDIDDYFEEHSKKYNNDTLFEDENLLNEIYEHYISLRKQNDGSDPDYCNDWRSCLEETINEYEDKLEKYKLFEGDTVYSPAGNKLTITSLHFDKNCNKLFGKIGNMDCDIEKCLYEGIFKIKDDCENQ